MGWGAACTHTDPSADLHGCVKYVEHQAAMGWKYAYEWMKEWRNEWVDEWMNEWVILCWVRRVSEVCVRAHTHERREGRERGKPNLCARSKLTASIGGVIYLRLLFWWIIYNRLGVMQRVLAECRQRSQFDRTELQKYFHTSFIMRVPSNVNCDGHFYPTFLTQPKLI